MKKLVSLLSLFAACTLLLSAAFAFPDEKAEAVKMVKDAAAYYNAHGLEKTLDVLNDQKGQFTTGELYVFAYDLSGTMMANVAKPAMVGQNVIDVPDSAGKRFRREIIERARKEGSGWVDYKTHNPKTNTVEEKTTYFEKAGEMVLACGIYKK